MSAGPDLTPLVVVFVGCIGTTALAVGGAAAALRGEGRHADWAPSLAWSTAALGGGALLIAEVGLRLLLESFGVEFGSRSFVVTAWFYLVWTLLLGPGLLLIGFVRRARRTPARILALQALDVVAWLLSCLCTLAFAIMASV